MLQTTKHLIFDLPSNLIVLRTIAMPMLANNLSIASDGFDQAVLTKETIGGVRFRDYRVSKPKQGDFNSWVLSGNLCLFWGIVFISEPHCSNLGQKFSGVRHR
jgi:hypothetical protein